MKKTLIIYCLLILLSLLVPLESCKKVKKRYRDNKHLIHLRSPLQRLKHYSPFTITGYSINGADSLSYINSKINPPYSLQNLEISFDENGKINFNNGINGQGDYALIFNQTACAIYNTEFLTRALGYDIFKSFKSNDFYWSVFKLENGSFTLAGYDTSSFQSSPLIHLTSK